MKTLSLAVAVFACQLVNASTVQTLRINNNDTSITSQSFKLNEAAFLKTYGKDDSSRALIKYFFYKRNSGKRTLYLLPLPFAMFGAISIINANQQVPGKIGGFNNFGDILITILLVIAIEGTVAIGLIGGIRMMFYSRKKLFFLLNNYFTGKGIPKHFSKSRIFSELYTTGKVAKRWHSPRYNYKHAKASN